MTSVAILPTAGHQGEVSYDAVAGDRRTHGRTAGEALDAMAAQLPEEAANTLIIVQYGRPDAFFTATQQGRLAELMERWRAARECDDTLPVQEQVELESLIAAEVTASARRSAALASALGK